MTVAVRFPAPRAPDGLGGAPGDLPWLGLRLEERQEIAFARARVARAPDEPWEEAVAAAHARGEAVLLYREDLAFLADAVKDLVAAGKARGTDLRFSLSGQSGALIEALSLGRAEPAMGLLRPGQGRGLSALERLAAAPLAEIDPKERVLPLPFRSPTGVEVVLPLTDRLALPVGHWVALLWANLLGLGPHLWRELLSPWPPLALLKLGLAAALARSTDPWRIGARLRRVGRGARIHPTATVEASVLGPGARVGAGAVVRGCVLGAGAVIEELAVVEGAVLAAGARVQRQALAKFSVIGQDAAFAGVMQLAVVGPQAVVKLGAILMDVSFGGDVRVAVDDRFVAPPFGMAGVCVGPRTALGTGVLVAPGRVLPPDLTILPPSSSILRTIPDGVTGICEVRDSRLVGR